MVKKFVILSVKSCYRSVCKHPFLVGMAFLLFLLYKSSPLLFSLLLSASPVFVTTAVLLATLLSFGQPNLPEIEVENEESLITTSASTTHLHKSGFGESDSVIVSKDRGFDDETERYYTEKEKRKDSEDEEEDEEVFEASIMGKDVGSIVDDRVSESSVADGGEFVGKENFLSRGIEEVVGEEVGRGSELEIGDSSDKETPNSQVMNNHYSKIQHTDDDEESADLEKEKLDEGSVGNLEAFGGSSWKRVDQGADNGDGDDDEEEDDDDVGSDSGSDGAESSSPDASMADIIPMLDELHPLLDEDEPTQTAQMSHDGSDAASEHSLASSDSIESDDDDDDIVDHEEFEVEEDEEEEETREDKEDETKSAITWTEDDQKNLMNLGTSELERNQRLENLIARRRARKSMRLMAEKNLIDFESNDLPFNIAPISTARLNPFDLPFDSNDNIPGSAPSILLPRRNPFDLPYDSSEEKPDLASDTFHQDFVGFHPQREAFFRRHESFNVGPSIFGPPRQERQEYKLRPYFIPERMAAEGTSYSSFRRQSSELSESKMSSVPDTESNGSVGDLEDMKVTEEDLSQEPESISVADHASHLVGHGSQSSEDVETVELGQVNSRDVELDGIEVRLEDFEDHQEVEYIISEPESEVTPRNLMTKGGGRSHSSRSSSSSSLEISEEIATENRGEELLEETRNDISVQPLTEIPQFDFTSLMVEESQHKEPVYDSSPRGSLTDVGKHDTHEADISVLEDSPRNNGDFHQHLASVEEISPVILDTFSPETEAIELRDKELNLQIEQVHSFSSDVKSDESVYEVADEKLVSTDESVADEESTSQPNKVLPLPETSVDESSSELPEKEQVEFDDERGTVSMEPSEIQETDNKVPSNNNFSSTFHFESTETEAPPTTDLPDVEVGKHDLVHDLGEEHWNFPSQLTDSHSDLPDNSEDDEEFKEIDENLLHELDNVGDFSIGVSEPQVSRIGSIEQSIVVDSPKNTESNDIESNVQVSTAKDGAMTDHGAESSSDEDSSSRVFDVKQDNEESSKSGSSSRTNSHDSGDER